jgi:hypothetical protein
MGGIAAEMKTPHTARESGKAKAIKTPEEIDQKKKKERKKERKKEKLKAALTWFSMAIGFFEM